MWEVWRTILLLMIPLAFFVLIAVSLMFTASNLNKIEEEREEKDDGN